MKGNQEEYSRYGKRSKRKKTNIILNSLIVVVLLLIIIVSYAVFSGNDNDNQAANGSENEEQTTETNENEPADTTEDVTEPADTEDEETQEDQETSGNENEENEEQTSDEVAPADSSQEVVTEGSEDSNIIRTIENPAWQPVGTVQTEHPGAVYDSSSVDWQESVKAITYATGLAEENMTIMFLGNNGVNKSVATVRSKDRTANYRVYIDWIDGEGWKPVKVEELREIQ
ncbi:MAG: YrrS family protein [Cytobacillus gottheilii]|uniref:YrrS family protein n=1 Tax=Cytobacillus gottheilii TaxID=859144 RepID=UPI0034641859